MKKYIFLGIFLAASCIGLHAAARVSVEAGRPHHRGYYYGPYYNDAVWIGPGVYYGVYISNEHEFYQHRRYHRNYRRHHHRHHRYHRHH